jgi:hypothetical protein
VEVMGMSQQVPAYVTLTGPQPTVFIVSFSIAASAAAGTVVQGSIQAFGALMPATQSVEVPITEVWSIVDFYTLSTVSPDAQIQLLINGYIQNIYPTLNSVYINNYKKWTLNQAIKIPPASTWSVNIVLLGANGSSAQTYTLYISAVRAPFVATTTK